MKPGNFSFASIFLYFSCLTESFVFHFLIRFEEQMAPGGGPPHRALSQVPGVFPQTAALHLVAAGNPHHQDCVLLHCPVLH